MAGRLCGRHSKNDALCGRAERQKRNLPGDAKAKTCAETEARTGLSIPTTALGPFAFSVRASNRPCFQRGIIFHCVRLMAET